MYDKRVSLAQMLSVAENEHISEKIISTKWLIYSAFVIAHFDDCVGSESLFQKLAKNCNFLFFNRLKF